MQNLFLFHVLDRPLGIRMPLVKNVQNTEAFHLSQSDNTYPQSLLIEGKKIPLYDLGGVLNDNGPNTFSATSKKILFTNDQQSSYAFLIDRIEGVVAVSDEQIGLLPPIFSGPARECFPEVLKMNDKLVLLLSPKNIEEQCTRLKEELIDKSVFENKTGANENPIETIGNTAPREDHTPPAASNPGDDLLTSKRDCDSSFSLEKTIESLVDAAKLEKMVSHSVANIVSNKMKLIFKQAFSKVDAKL